MTATTTTPARTERRSAARAQRGFDLDSVPPVPFRRTVATELRKMVDTSAGLGLIIAIAAVTVAGMIVDLLIQLVLEVGGTFASFFDTTRSASGLLLPVLGMVLLTTEWSQRTAMITFTLEPNRLKVLAGKYVAGLLAVIAAVLLSTGVAAAAAAVRAGVYGEAGVWDLSLAVFAGSVAGQLLLFTAGFALACLVGNLAVTVVIFFILELVGWTLLPIAGAIEWLAPIEPWINFGNARGPLVDGQLFGGAVGDLATVEAWGHLATSSALWVVLPLIIGAVRFLKRETK